MHLSATAYIDEILGPRHGPSVHLYTLRAIKTTMKASLVLQIWFGSLLYALRCQAKHCHDSQQLKESYDYVIIGGGTSGLVVANRLTENPDGNV